MAPSRRKGGGKAAAIAAACRRWKVDDSFPAWPAADADERLEGSSNKEKEDITSKQKQSSMTRLNRMSLESDYFVDRRIVVKLLVTYFQRNHTKEVLDLMVRMLGFSEEDKEGLEWHMAIRLLMTRPSLVSLSLLALDIASHWPAPRSVSTSRNL